MPRSQHRARAAAVALTLVLACGEAAVRPRARGFVYAYLDPARGAATRAIDCLE